MVLTSIRWRAACVALLFWLASQVALAAVPAKRALLIGINDYLANDLDSSQTSGWVPPDLRGALNDVGLLREVLVSRYGFARENVEILTDRAASRSRILEALQALVRRAGPEDVVYIHFSGHGSQVPDTNGDESDDRLDETILPFDARTPGIPDITDDELGAIFRDLRSDTVLVVLDSCHSGTGTRDVQLLTRSVPADPRQELYEESAPTTRGENAAADRYVLMTGAAAYQSALDGPLEGTFYGFFSYALGRSLARAAHGATARDIHRGVQQEFERIAAKFGLSSLPDPQLEGPIQLHSRPLLARRQESSSRAASLAWLEVRPLGPGAALLVYGGAAGATPGSLWAIYPPGELRFDPGAAQAIGTVTETRQDDAILELRPKDREVLAGSRSIALGPVNIESVTSVRLERVEPGELGPPLASALNSAMSSRGQKIEFVAPERFARYLVEVADGTCRLLGAGGLQTLDEFEFESTERAAQRLASSLTRYAVLARLMALENPASRLPLTARVVRQEQEDEGPPVETGGAAAVPTFRMRRPGEPRSEDSSLMLEIEAGESSYLTIVNVDSEGRLNQLFPNPGSEAAGFLPDGLIPGLTRVRLPDSLASDNQAGFHWDYGPPPGQDSIRIFASTDRATTRRIRDLTAQLSRLTQQRDRGPAQPSPHERGLRELISSRGIVVVVEEESAQSRPEPSATTAAVGEWTAVTINLLVKE